MVEIPLKNNQIFVVTQEDIDGWTEAYPTIDIRQELLSIREWNKAAPGYKRKTPGGIRRHINGWLKKSYLAKKKENPLGDWKNEIKHKING